MKIKLEKEHMSPLTKVPNEIEIVTYNSIKECYARSWGCGEDELDFECDGGFVDIDGNEQNVNTQQVIDHIKETGIWGFINTRDNEMHIWVDYNKVDDIEIICFLSHELGHFQKPNKRDYLQEEQKAEHYADITRFAYTMFKKIKVKQ